MVVWKRSRMARRAACAFPTHPPVAQAIGVFCFVIRVVREPPLSAVIRIAPFVFAEKEIPFPEHTHGEQWTVVLEGEYDFTANGKTCVYKKEGTYHIPAGMLHQITLHPGYAEMNYTVDEEKPD